MPRLVAFLRAINVGGHVVTMAELRKHFEALGFGDVETFIASGNVVFSARAGSPAAFERKIEARLQKALGYEVRTFVRTGAEVAAVAACRPFAEARIASGVAFSVGFHAEPIAAAAARALQALGTRFDEFHVRGREVYWLSQTRQSDSPMSNLVFAKTLKAPGTFRNMNTVARLVAKHGFEPASGPRLL